MWAIFDGTGSYRIGNLTLKPGATYIDDPAIVARLQRLRIPWITLSETREIAPPEADPPVPEIPITYDKFLGRDEKWYFHYPIGSGEGVKQSIGYDTEDEVDAAIIEARDGQPEVPLASELESPEAPLSGTLTATDVTQNDWPCRAEGCDHAPFTSENARTNHERIRHPELYGGEPRSSVPTVPPPPPAPPVPEREDDPDVAGVPNPNPQPDVSPVVDPPKRKRKKAKKEPESAGVPNPSESEDQS